MKALPIFVRYSAYTLRREAFRIWCRVLRNRNKQALTVFDPSLTDFSGHHMEFAKIIKEECQSSFDVRFYANFRAKTKLLLSLPAQPICDHGIYLLFPDFDETYRVHTASTAAALAKIDTNDIGSKTLLVMHTATLYQLGALAQWFSTLRVSERPKMCVQFQFPVEFRLGNDEEICQRAISLTRSSAGVLAATGRVRFAANSASLARHVSKQLNQKCATLPLPTRWPDLSSPILPDPGVAFGFFGGLRAEKGASIIGHAIPEFVACYPDSRFLVHAPPLETDSSVISDLERLPQVELIQRNFETKEDYFKQFTRASCILLPYDPNEYAYRTSGILIEALGLGRLIITTKESWLSAEADRRGGNVIHMTSFTCDALFAALEAAHSFLKVNPLKPKINRDIISENSPAAFCSALVRLTSEGEGNEV